MTAEKILAEANEQKDEIVGIRRHLHQNAEIGFKLENTVKFVKSKLSEMGIECNDCGHSGVVAVIGKCDEGSVLLLRADMDALPIREESGEEFASESGNMHACGHDMHTAMLLGAARILKAHESELRGRVKLMLQPAEELLEGAKNMIESGVLEDPRPDAAMMLHVMTGVPLEVGTAIVSSGGVSAPAADYFEITVSGKGCHGSMPNAGVDPITAAAHIVTGLHNIKSMELSMSERAVLTVGRISAGDAANVIPDAAKLSGTMRAFDENTREFIKERICEIAGLAAKTFRAEAKVEFTSGCPSLLNNDELSESVYNYAKELFGEGRVFTSDEMREKSDRTNETSGSEDFAYVSREVPSIMVALAAGSTERGYTHPLHHPSVRFDEEALVSGSALFAFTAMRYLEDVKK